MKRLRHRLGRWLLRDAPPPQLEAGPIMIEVNAAVLNAALRQELRKKRLRGERGLGA
jgi:hypothetical protein